MADLNDIMEFDHVIRVHDDGTITAAPNERKYWAPELYNGELYGDGWELLDGYSGQEGYAGPIMHVSEYIGGGLERDIRSTPGVYVAIVSVSASDSDSEDDTESDIDGWAVARLKETVVAE